MRDKKQQEAEEQKTATECGQDCPCPDSVQDTENTAGADGTENAEPTPEDELVKWRELAMRTAAEYDNYRKRCVKDREDFAKYANRSLLEELLPVIDNFEMGMQMAEKDQGSMIYIGMKMVQKQLADFLDGQGVESIPAEPGQMFDHNIHEAIMSEPSDQPEGTVLRILRKGYNLRGRLLRPVNVVTAAPAEQAAEEPQA